MRRQIAAALVALSLGLMAGISVPVLAEQLAQASGSVMAAGDIRAVDKDAGQLTIDHGSLLNLNLPAAIRVFQVRDRGVLDQLEVGDSVLFLAENIAGRLTVIRIEIPPGAGHGEH